jgi:ribosome-binding protein aMBF1 (putative translation factor)
VCATFVRALDGDGVMGVAPSSSFQYPAAEAVRTPMPTAERAREIRARIGTIVKTLREAKGYSQEVLATRSLLSRSVISRIESGHHEPRISTLLALADVLGVPAATFLEGL